MAGIMIEPMATTVATLDPEIAANSAQATTPASPRPPGRWPTSEVVKLIMPLRDAAARQERAGQDEERDRHDREIVEAGKQLQADALDRHLSSW